jgi:hypothetical protein
MHANHGFEGNACGPRKARHELVKTGEDKCP